MNVNEFVDAVESEIMNFPKASERFFFAGQFDVSNEIGPCVDLLLESRILNVHTCMRIRKKDIETADPKNVAEVMRNAMKELISTACSYGPTEPFNHLTIAPKMESAEKAGYRADFTVIDEWGDHHA